MEKMYKTGKYMKAAGIRFKEQYGENSGKRYTKGISERV